MYNRDTICKEVFIIIEDKNLHNQNTKKQESYVNSSDLCVLQKSKITIMLLR